MPTLHRWPTTAVSSWGIVEPTAQPLGEEDSAARAGDVWDGVLQHLTGITMCHRVFWHLIITC